jgi:hypothetical protein
MKNFNHKDTNLPALPNGRQAAGRDTKKYKNLDFLCAFVSWWWI